MCPISPGSLESYAGIGTPSQQSKSRGKHSKAGKFWLSMRVLLTLTMNAELEDGVETKARRITSQSTWSSCSCSCTQAVEDAVQGLEAALSGLGQTTRDICLAVLAEEESRHQHVTQVTFLNSREKRECSSPISLEFVVHSALRE